MALQQEPVLRACVTGVALQELALQELAQHGAPSQEPASQEPASREVASSERVRLRTRPLVRWTAQA